MTPWLFMALWFALATRGAGATAECNSTPKQDLLPGVIAPMAGRDPVWFIETTGGSWQGGAPVKSVWVLARHSKGELKASGRLRGAAGILQFRRGLDGPLTDTLSIQDPLSESMIPGGATADVMKKFAFVSSYIYFPSAGCWEITTEWGGALSTVVVLL